ncbi:NAD-dependent protein deacetylase sirtuin-3 isoform X3 [Ochotona princeps]|uniref:NAD-dependent protein deacetylase sirtuin-3-like isoform X3 n=1 Tax=Ochotona princeps TaxID=9978 RepID=UPI002714FB5C|nr:NAD-dependent protein deacetylase sirtuin-3-like isoform X3 [Ochotona princeps]XP_058518569.1 NAD-dependent protein deacetylase sirtuin-3 isoform X3 [Ochotona princeps]
MALWGRCAVAARRLWGLGGGGKLPPLVNASAISGSPRSSGKFSLQDVAGLIRSGACQRVVVMVGAGISTPSGIPDFRSCTQGSTGPMSPTTSSACCMTRGCFCGCTRRTLTGLRGLPASHPLSWWKPMGHSPLPHALCVGAASPVDVMAGRVPCCPVCTGVVKPDIVFFGEPLPHRFFLHVVDFPMADLLLILGTSLEVEPFASLSEAVRNSVPRVLINWSLVGSLASHPRSRDVAQLGDVVHGVEELVDLLGWTQDMRDLVQQETRKLDGLDK